MFPGLPLATESICRSFKTVEGPARSAEPSITGWSLYPVREPDKRVIRSRKRSGTHPDPGSSGEPMKQTDDEANEALAHIRRTTAAPIQRFLDSIAAARLVETTSRRDRVADGPSRL